MVAFHQLIKGATTPK